MPRQSTPFPSGDTMARAGGGLGDLLMKFLQVTGELPNQALGPHAGIANELLEGVLTGGARGDEVMGAAPGLPPLGGMAGRLGKLLGRGGPRAYQGTAPLRGSQGIPHTSPLPNPGGPPRGGGPLGGFADDAAGNIRGDVTPTPTPGSTLGDAPPIRPSFQAPRNMGMDVGSQFPYKTAGATPEGLDLMFQEWNALNRHGQVPYEEAVEYMVNKHGEWVLSFL